MQRGSRETDFVEVRPESSGGHGSLRLVEIYRSMCSKGGFPTPKHSPRRKWNFGYLCHSLPFARPAPAAGSPGTPISKIRRWNGVAPRGQNVALVEKKRFRWSEAKVVGGAKCVQTGRAFPSAEVEPSCSYREKKADVGGSGVLGARGGHIPTCKKKKKSASSRKHTAKAAANQDTPSFHPKFFSTQWHRLPTHRPTPSH